MQTKLLMGTTVLASLLIVAAPRAGNALVATPLPSPAQGKLWMVPLDTGGPQIAGLYGANAVFPVPSAVPDVTFTIPTVIDFFATTGGAGADAYTVAGFLLPGVASVVFSGDLNANVGEIVGPNTALWQQGVGDGGAVTGWATYMQITGQLLLANGDKVEIDHDDGVSLKFNDVLTGCFASPNGHYTAADEPEPCRYNGPSGLVDFDLVYTEGFDVNARLTLAVPEPTSLSLLGVGLLGVGLRRRWAR